MFQMVRPDDEEGKGTHREKNASCGNTKNKNNSNDCWVVERGCDLMSGAEWRKVDQLYRLP